MASNALPWSNMSPYFFLSMEDYRNGGNFAVKCLVCTTSRYICTSATSSSNLRKHLKRIHPTIKVKPLRRRHVKGRGSELEAYPSENVPIWLQTNATYYQAKMDLSNVLDSALEELRCSRGRHLSSTPTFGGKDGQRISSKSTIPQPQPPLGITNQNVACEGLTALSKFPCCYKPQGCLQSAGFNNASVLEYECPHGTYKCPVNLLSSCSKSGTTTELCDHYESNHPDLYLQQPTFAIDVSADFEFHRLFKVEKVLFLLQSKCSINAGKLWFNTIYYGNSINASLIRCNIKLSSTDDKKRVMELEQVNACSINSMLMLPFQFVEVDIAIALAFLKNSKILCHWAIHIPEVLNDRVMKQEKLELGKTFEAKKESIRCPFCRISMVPPIYRCDLGHVTCIDCRGYDNQCRSCLKTGFKFIAASDLELISKSVIHNCKWRNCNQKFSHDMIRLHEQECFYRIYTCPECNWSGRYDKFLSHFKNVHDDVNIHVTNAVALNLLNCPGSYLVVHREIFKFVVVRQPGFGAECLTCDINVHFLGSPTYANHWKYEVKDNLENVYFLEGGHHIATVRIHDAFQVQTNWKFGNMCLYSGKSYTLYIIKRRKDL